MMKYWHLAPALLLLIGCAPQPRAAFTVEQPTGAAPIEVRFTNTSTDADSYSWDFGDGTSSAEANPIHTFTRFGNMIVRLQAKKGEAVSEFSDTLNIPEPPRRMALIETPYGAMKVELSNRTPQHRDNFIKLVEQGFYDGLLFHRVIPTFMIQGGDPTSKGAPAGTMLGMGDPGYTIPAEIDNELMHVKGALAAARQSDQVNPEKRSSGSQFYIVQGQPVAEQLLTEVMGVFGFQYTPEQLAVYKSTPGTPQLDRQYTVFGQVVEGLEVIDKIAALPADANNRPIQDVPMTIKMLP